MSCAYPCHLRHEANSLDVERTKLSAPSKFTVMGMPCVGLNGGTAFEHSEAFSFQVATDTQEETDRYWNAIVSNGGGKVNAAGARTAGGFPGRSRRGC